MSDLNNIDEIKIDRTSINSEEFFKITNSDLIRPFFMSIVSHSNHWMFIASNGGITAGRKDANHALFPYYTDDKITESIEDTGCKSIFIISRGTENFVWEPFTERYPGQYVIQRNLYKSVYGNKIRFEEINRTLKLTFSYQWNLSERFGFVKESLIINGNEKEVSVRILDGLQNILPSGIPGDLQNQASNLVDAYKRSELDQASGLGIYALSAVIVDKAEPSESLSANVVWSSGLENPIHLLSSLQLKKWRHLLPISEEKDVKAERGAYFVEGHLKILPGKQKEWMIVADVNKDHAAVIKLSQTIRQEPDLEHVVREDIKKGTSELLKLNASADGLQLTSDSYRDARHFSNTMFNIMRGGIFDNNYTIEQADFKSYLASINKETYKNAADSLETLGAIFSLFELKRIAQASTDRNFERLSLEYLPLKFSRRHGDPSRPWNKFSINMHDEVDGSKVLDYEGNWRDIFQNWEALGHSYPEFVESMVRKFLNATTFDGYNPYRVTKDGFDWEIIEPDNPWSYIGYWGDHQIIYLLKLLEFMEDHQTGRLAQLFQDELFVYANVPYKIKTYNDLLENPKDTIYFDQALDASIRKLKSKQGSDGALLYDVHENIYQVNFIEKILVTILAKLSNFIPEAGIWMNTQRPEWNDANNALVGNGVSMVTLCYLRRFLSFFYRIIEDTESLEVKISSELYDFFIQIMEVLDRHISLLDYKIDDKNRKTILDGLGEAGSHYRHRIYQDSFSGERQRISLIQIQNFVNVSLQYLDHSISVNKRTDHLYHAYNLISISSPTEISITHLSEMLEGQVAVLSTGFLSSEEALALLDSLRGSALFREDQFSYLLYPNKDLPGFLEKNNLSGADIEQSQLLMKMLTDNDHRIIKPDIVGSYHFNAKFRNAGDLQDMLDQLTESKYYPLVARESKLIHEIFENEFKHRAFTGRSGTFFGYEGLGSIYWHMVSKLQLAVQETCLKAIKNNTNAATVGRLLDHYYNIREGIGVHKSPSEYGAFPTDPYSHTPAGKGAQQPGMTGQVKEDILSRFGELGVSIQNAYLGFNPCLLRENEFLKEAKRFDYIDVSLAQRQIHLDKDSLCFTCCQVPVIYKISKSNRLQIDYEDGSIKWSDSLQLDHTTSKQVFRRTGKIVRITVYIERSKLR